MKKNANKNRKEITMDTRETQKTLEEIKGLVRENNISYSTAIQLMRLQNELDQTEKLNTIAHVLNSLTVYAR